MNKFANLQAQSVDQILMQPQLLDLVSKRHLPRQIMLLDAEDNTLFNYEYPHFPYCRGLYTGPERYVDDVLKAIKDNMDQGKKVAELYFLGSRNEYSNIVDAIAKYKESMGKTADFSVQTYFVQYDIESLREEVSASSAREAAAAKTSPTDNVGVLNNDDMALFEEHATESTAVVGAGDTAATVETIHIDNVGVLDDDDMALFEEHIAEVEQTIKALGGGSREDEL